MERNANLTSGRLSRGIKPQQEDEDAPPIRAFRLKLLMKERELAAEKLIKIDFAIWTLEEFFRKGAL
jgi:hypothetical protein